MASNFGGGRSLAWRAWLPDEPPRRWQALLLGGTLAGAATLARGALEAPLGHELPFITYFPALIIAAAWGGATGGLTCLLVSTVAAWLLFLPPEGPPPTWAIGSFWVAGGLIIFVGAALADSVRELRRNRKRLDEAQGELQTLVGELAHRNRNALSVIMSIVSQSARSAASATDAARIINDRLNALARAQQEVVQSHGAAVPLNSIVDTTLAPFGLERFDIAPSPDADVAPDAAAPLALVVHEMATNAVKYGALSRPDGSVTLDWTIESGKARLSWRERGGPEVAEPTVQGFGTRLFGAALAPHGGTIERRFEREGLTYELLFPATGCD